MVFTCLCLQVSLMISSSLGKPDCGFVKILNSQPQKSRTCHGRNMAIFHSELQCVTDYEFALFKLPVLFHSKYTINGQLCSPASTSVSSFTVFWFTSAWGECPGTRLANGPHLQFYILLQLREGSIGMQPALLPLCAHAIKVFFMKRFVFFVLILKHHGISKIPGTSIPIASC